MIRESNLNTILYVLIVVISVLHSRGQWQCWQCSLSLPAQRQISFHYQHDWVTCRSTRCPCWRTSKTMSKSGIHCCLTSLCPKELRNAAFLSHRASPVAQWCIWFNRIQPRYNDQRATLMILHVLTNNEEIVWRLISKLLFIRHNNEFETLP